MLKAVLPLLVVLLLSACAQPHMSIGFDESAAGGTVQTVTTEDKYWELKSSGAYTVRVAILGQNVFKAGPMNLQVAITNDSDQMVLFDPKQIKASFSPSEQQVALYRAVEIYDTEVERQRDELVKLELETGFYAQHLVSVNEQFSTIGTVNLSGHGFAGRAMWGEVAKQGMTRQVLADVLLRTRSIKPGETYGGIQVMDIPKDLSDDHIKLTIPIGEEVHHIYMRVAHHDPDWHEYAQ